MELVYLTGQYLVSHGPQLVGIILPPFADYVNKEVYSEKQRFFLTVGLVFFATLLLHWEKLVYGSPEDFLTSLGLIFTESQLVYNLYWKRSNLRQNWLNFVSPTQPEEIKITPKPPSQAQNEAIPSVGEGSEQP